MREEYWLDICYHLHIPPREQDRMTVVEYHQACSAIDSIRADLAKSGG